MLKIERRQIEVLDFAYLKREPNAIIDTRNYELYSSLSIRQSIIDILELPATIFHSEIIIHACIIKEIKLPYCWFKNGLEFTNNTILQEATFEAGGHNKNIYNEREYIPWLSEFLRLPIRGYGSFL